MTLLVSDFIQNNREYLIKQSEMLQAIINRMANNSLTIKQLGITLWTALIGFGFTNDEPSLFLLAILAFILLGLLDNYYLYLERQFRKNFNFLTELLSGYYMEDDSTKNQIKKLKGNFIKPQEKCLQKAFGEYLYSLTSWANFPYWVLFIITLLVWKMD